MEDWERWIAGAQGEGISLGMRKTCVFTATEVLLFCEMRTF
jgi:hypothetical protein